MFSEASVILFTGGGMMSLPVWYHVPSGGGGTMPLPLLFHVPSRGSGFSGEEGLVSGGGGGSGPRG